MLTTYITYKPSKNALLLIRGDEVIENPANISISEGTFKVIGGRRPELDWSAKDKDTVHVTYDNGQFNVIKGDNYIRDVDSVWFYRWLDGHYTSHISTYKATIQQCQKEQREILAARMDALSEKCRQILAKSPTPAPKSTPTPAPPPAPKPTGQPEKPNETVNAQAAEYIKAGPGEPAKRNEVVHADIANYIRRCLGDENDD